MKEVRCLYWDDEGEEDLLRYEGWIKRAWSKLETGVPISLKAERDPGAASDIIRASGENYDLFVVDIFWGPDESDPRGLHLIDEARSQHPNLAIVALSRAGEEGRARALQARADRFVSKQVLSRTDITLSSLSQALLEALQEKGREPVPTESTVLRFDQDNILLAAIIEALGRDKLAALILKIVRPRECEEIEVSYVTPGLSGAMVLRVECRLKVALGRAPERKALLLKVARDKEMIEAELTRRMEVSTFPDNLFVSFGEGEMVDSAGWYAISAGFQSSATTLHEWLGRKPSEDAVDLTLGALFGENGLSHVYRLSAYSEDERANVAIWRDLALQRRARVLLALEELSLLASKYDPSGRFDPSVILRFIGEAKRIVNLDEDEFPRGVSVCRSHGDLHSRNVLVVGGKGGGVRLVDPASIRQAHWASDISRLAVDLVVSVLDNGAIGHEWNSMAEWFEISRDLILGTGSDLGSVPTNRVAVVAALSWMRRSAREIFAGVKIGAFEAELRLALAAEFLRASYRLGGSTPKRVLGLIAGCEALRATAEEIAQN